MPRCYTRILLAFPVDRPLEELLSVLQKGLDVTCKSMPWLAGRVIPTTSSTTGKPSLEIHWNADQSPPKVLDLGKIPTVYEEASKDALPLTAIPDETWPAPGMIDNKMYDSGAPVLIAGVVQFADSKGIGLCICLHHNVVDGGGFGEVVRLWSLHTSSNSPPAVFQASRRRLDRLTAALASHTAALGTVSLDSLLNRHPEYSTSFTRPSFFPPCASKVFRLRTARLAELKSDLRTHATEPFSINTVLCAVIWSVFTVLRHRREPTLYPADRRPRLGMAVNGRPRISPDFSTPETPYPGNVNLYSLAQTPASTLVSAGANDAAALAKVCAAIAASNAPSKVNTRHVAECAALIDRLDDYRTLLPGWTVYNGPDLTVTSWANLGIADADFGTGLGVPEFVRVPYARADSLCIVLPRRRKGVEEGNDVMEVVVMMREDDLAAIEREGLWMGLLA